MDVLLQYPDQICERWDMTLFAEMARGDEMQAHIKPIEHPWTKDSGLPLFWRWKAHQQSPLFPKQLQRPSRYLHVKKFSMLSCTPP